MKVDVHSATWSEVETRAKAEIAKASGRLEMPLSHDETNIERGKIIALREILKLGDPPVERPIMTGEVTGY